MHKYDLIRQDLLDDYIASSGDRRKVLFTEFIQPIENLESLSIAGLVSFIAQENKTYGYFRTDYMFTQTLHTVHYYQSAKLFYIDELVWEAISYDNQPYEVKVWKSGVWESEILFYLKESKKVELLLDEYVKNYY